jgi:hypothetical protein
MKQFLKITSVILTALFIMLYINNRAYSQTIECTTDADCVSLYGSGWTCDPLCCCAAPPGATGGGREGGTLVELSTFEALFRKGKVIVHWVTESEKDCAGFDIERSLKPHEGYQKINGAMIPAKGDEITGAEYGFVDKHIKRRKYYYQLKEYELGGGINYYGPTSIDLRPKGIIRKLPKIIPKPPKKIKLSGRKK